MLSSGSFKVPLNHETRRISTVAVSLSPVFLCASPSDRSESNYPIIRKTSKVISNFIYYPIISGECRSLKCRRRAPRPRGKPGPSSGPMGVRSLQTSLGCPGEMSLTSCPL